MPPIPRSSRRSPSRFRGSRRKRSSRSACDLRRTARGRSWRLVPANRVAVIDTATKKVEEISARRPARLAIGFYAGRQISLYDQWRFERCLGDRCGEPQGRQIDPGRFFSLGRCDRAPMSFSAPDPEAASGQPWRDLPPRWRSRASAIATASARLWSDVSFSVRPASFCVLLGLNGAGKSTLFCLITRLFAAQKGSDPYFRLRREPRSRRGAAQARCRVPGADARSRSDGPAKSLLSCGAARNFRARDEACARVLSWTRSR